MVWFDKKNSKIWSTSVENGDGADDFWFWFFGIIKKFPISKRHSHIDRGGGANFCTNGQPRFKGHLFSFKI